MQSLRLKSVYSLVVVAVSAATLGACGGGNPPAAATNVKVQPAVAVPAPDGIAVKVTGTSAVVTWGAPKGLTTALKGYDFYLDQSPSVSLGPQVTSRKLTGLASDTHYVQVVALAGDGQSLPVAQSFSVAYPNVTPGPSAVAPTTPAPAPVSVATTPPPVVITVEPQPGPTTLTISAPAACETAVPDFGTVDSDSAAVIRGDDNEIATGHTFGSIILELQGLIQNVSDRQLAALINKGTDDVVLIRNLFIAGGDPMTIPDNVDPDFQAVQEYCSSVNDPLGSTA